MDILSHFRIRSKLALLVGLSVLALIAVIMVSASLVRQRMFEERIDKDRAVVQTTIGIAQSLQDRVAAHELTHEQALAMMRDDIHAMRFDSGAGYVYAQTLDNIMILHGVSPALEGKPASALDANGKPVIDLIRTVLRNADDGVIAYAFPRPGRLESQPKIAYVARFRPWDLVFVSGAYVDDIDSAFRATLLRLSLIGGTILLVLLLAAWMISRDISRSLANLKTAMEHLANGELSTEILGTGRHDEVGAMAGAVLVFKAHMEAEKRAGGKERENQRAAGEKHAALVGMVENIETETTKAISEVGARTTAMTATAEKMSASALRTGLSAQSAASASGQALANAKTVASAAEQLSASIHEIGVQVARSSAIVGRAVAAGSETRATIEALNGQVGRIGAVADMIGEIAAKTNLLALNATIEAARAGDAGKGFAVVASEVKALATQTARSTKEIAEHIGQVRDATGVSVAAVERIERTIGEIDAIAGSIAAAVEEQGAATAEIARNVAETASAANTMTGHATEVSTEARQTGEHAAEVCTDAAGLNASVVELRHSLIRLVRRSATEMDRRHEGRYPENLTCRLSIAGRTSSARVADLSEHGASVRDAPAIPIGTRGTVTIEGVGFALPFRVSAAESDTSHLTFELDAATATKFRPFPERLAIRKVA